MRRMLVSIASLLATAAAGCALSLPTDYASTADQVRNVLTCGQVQTGMVDPCAHLDTSRVAYAPAPRVITFEDGSTAIAP